MYPDLVDDPVKQNEFAFFTMTILGVGEIIGGTLIGQIRDRKGYIISLIAQILFLLIGIILIAIVNSKNKFNVNCWIMAFMFGI